MNPDSSIGLSTFGKSPVLDFAKLIVKLLFYSAYATLSPRVPLNGRVGALWCISLSIEVLPSFVRFSTQIMARKKRHRKNDANTGKVSEEL